MDGKQRILRRLRRWSIRMGGSIRKLHTRILVRLQLLSCQGSELQHRWRLGRHKWHGSRQMGKIGTIGGSVWVSSVSVVSIGQPWLGIRFSFGFSLADVVSSSIGGDWGGISGMGVDSGWVSISTIGGSVWVSSISVVSIGQPWLGIRFGFSGSLSDEVSSISGVSGVSKSIGGIWVGTIGGVSSGVWVS